MKLTDKLSLLMKHKQLNKRQLAQQTDLPYTTIVGLFTKGYAGARYSTLRVLSNYFNITLDCLCDDEIDELIYKTDVLRHPNLEFFDQLLLDCYHAASDDDKAVVDTVLRKYRKPTEQSAAI